MRTRKNNDRMLLESLVNKYGKKNITSAIDKMNEGKYGPTGKEAQRKLQTTECIKYQDILDKFNEIGYKDFPNLFHDFRDNGWRMGAMYLRFPNGNDVVARRLAQRMEYDDIYIMLQGTSLYYIITKDYLFNFDDIRVIPNTAILGPRTAKFFYSVIKAINPNTKVKLTDLAAD